MSDDLRAPGMTPSKKLNPMMGSTACDVLESLRLCYKTRHFSSMMAYVEELQAMFDRMENAIEDYQAHANGYGGLSRTSQKLRELKSERRKLQMEVVDLKIQAGELESQIEEKEAGLIKVGADIVQMISSELKVDLHTSGALFTKMRKAGFIFMRREKN